MEVLDYYTGKYRSVKTLSGGESFKVSLSLALGMSDVIQAQSGGIRVETMFIDEGFGTLDGESLDQACLVLQGLTESNRLIGLMGIIHAFNAGCQNKYEIADFLDVTEEYLEECISCYRDKYGVYTTVDNYVIYFIPYLTVIKML